ncbi:MAG TPA: septation protein SpoVG family protein [Tepidisphaeraceae bacterium]|jgi:stage V sporulation protein G|nr:septation protein SpoVG family protein [Tepidisphaeraceae bacterium]
MQLSEIRINLCGPQAGRLKAFCSLTFDNTFVIRDVKIIEGNDGLFLAMPSRKLCDRCRRCGDKNHLRARFCNNCGQRLDENRSMRIQGVGMNGGARLKLHADIAHPINAECRLEIERRAVTAYQDELDRSKLPGYIPPNIDGDLADLYDDHSTGVTDNHFRLRPTGTDVHTHV